MLSQGWSYIHTHSTETASAQEHLGPVGKQHSPFSISSSASSSVSLLTSQVDTGFLFYFFEQQLASYDHELHGHCRRGWWRGYLQQ